MMINDYSILLFWSFKQGDPHVFSTQCLCLNFYVGCSEFNKGEWDVIASF